MKTMPNLNDPPTDVMLSASHASERAYKKWTFFSWWVLVITLLITATATLHMASRVKEDIERGFISRSDDICTALRDRLNDYARILRSGVAIFNVSDEVTREKWRLFTQTYKAETQLLGIQGIGFSLLIPRAELAQHIQKIRSEGFPAYTVRPSGDRENYSSIIYLEPFSGRNLLAFGYDMLPEPVRRKAMERARDTDSAALSGKVILVQETGEDIQAGTLMYVPVYRKGMPTTSVDQRCAAIYGWVYSPYRMKDMINGMLSAHNLKKAQQLHLKIYDGEQPSPDALLYGCHPGEDESLLPDVCFTRQLPVDFNGCRWTLHFTQAGGGFLTAKYTLAWLTLGGGTLIALLLFVLIRILLSTRDKAQRIAETLTVDLRKSEEKYRDLIETTDTGFLILDSGGKVIDANAEYVRLAGYRELGDILGKSAIEWTADYDRQRNAEAVAQCVKAGFIKNFVVDYVDGNGRITPVEVNASISETGEAMHIVSLCRDITERRQAERELQKLDKLQSIGTLAGGIAHDFNNILQGLYGNISFAKEELPRDHPSFAFLDESEKSMTRAVRLTKQLLTFAKGGNPVKDFINLGIMVGEVARFDLAGSNVSLVFPPAKDLWLVDADWGQVEQVVSNLVINARQAMPKGGCLTITLENADLSAEAVPFLKQGRYVKVILRDEGIGIDPKLIGQIFDPYFTTKQISSGLGLTIVWSILHKHGGHIDVVSKLGKGTTFTFWLPASASLLPEETKPPTEECPAPPPPAKILVLEDEESISKILVRMLTPCGYAVVTTPNGQESVALYRQAMEAGAPFDAVILDLTIPGGPGGAEVIQDLLLLDPKVRAIVSSGYANNPVMADPAAYGFQGTIAKPYSVSALRKIVASLIR